MKKSGILHAELSKIIALLGHGQTIVIADYGLPVPAGVLMIDLAIRAGVPSFLDVLGTILEELKVEGYVVATELQERNPQLANLVHTLIGQSRTFESHETFKQQVNDAVAVVRTGEHSAYANVILRAGVVF